MTSSDMLTSIREHILTYFLLLFVTYVIYLYVGQKHVEAYWGLLHFAYRLFRNSSAAVPMINGCH